MRKEITMAIIFGLVAGLLITFGVYYFRNRGRSQEAQNLTVTEKIVLDAINNPTDGTRNSSSLVRIVEPLNESVSVESDVNLVGVAFPDQLVIVFINEDDQIITADAEGNFELPIKLESGSNILSVHAINPETSVTISDQITVVHSNKSLEETLVTDQEVKAAAQQ